jgi:hypothetical protein
VTTSNNAKDALSIDHKIKIWEKLIDVQMHFNDLKSQSQTLFITIISASLAGAGYLFTQPQNKEKPFFTITLPASPYPLTSLILLLLLVIVAYHCISQVLLEGKEKAGENFEDKEKTVKKYSNGLKSKHLASFITIISVLLAVIFYLFAQNNVLQLNTTLPIQVWAATSIFWLAYWFILQVLPQGTVWSDENTDVELCFNALNLSKQAFYISITCIALVVVSYLFFKNQALLFNRPLPIRLWTIPILGASLFTLAFSFLDYGILHVLLKGAVQSGIDFEKKHLNLPLSSCVIDKMSKKHSHFGFIGAKAKLLAFYWIIGLACFVLFIVANYCPIKPCC